MTMFRYLGKTPKREYPAGVRTVRLSVVDVFDRSKRYEDLVDTYTVNEVGERVPISR
jgi:hypothetical protein